MRFRDHALGELLDFYDHVRVPLSSMERENRQGPYRYYGAQNVIDHIDEYLFDGEYVLIAEDGANLITRQDPIAFLVDGQFWVNNHAHIVRGKDKIADNYFIVAWLNNANIAGFVTGVAQPKLSQQNLKQVKIQLPSFEEQRRITGVLSAYTDLIENNRRRIALLEEAARQLYQEWFVRLRFPGHEQSRIIDGVPEGWERRLLFDFANPTYGYAFQAKLFTDGGEGLPVVRIRDVLAGESKTFTVEEAPADRRLQNGDFLIGMDGDFHMGLWAGGEAWLNQRVVRIRGTGQIDDYLLFWMLREPVRTLNETITGTTVVHLGAKELKTIVLQTPCDSLLARVNDLFSPIGKQLVMLKMQNQKLRAARDLLLPRLMSGEVAV
jgi:type I restriction enzyme, S subunit